MSNQHNSDTRRLIGQYLRRSKHGRTVGEIAQRTGLQRHVVDACLRRNCGAFHRAGPPRACSATGRAASPWRNAA